MGQTEATIENRLCQKPRTFRLYFTDKAKLSWWDRLFTRPGLRHVYTATKAEETLTWVFMDWRRGSLEAEVLLDAELVYLDRHIRESFGACIEITVKPNELQQPFNVPLLYCVALARSQLGLPWWVLTPGQLFREACKLGGLIRLDYRETDDEQRKRRTEAGGEGAETPATGSTRSPSA